MKISRRDFFLHSSQLFFSLSPILNATTSPLVTWQSDLFKNVLPKERNILLVIHLAGGNDWFNTVIPYKAASYYRNRPSLAVPAQTVLDLDHEYAFHPELYGIKLLYDRNKVAVLLNAGYLANTLSHQKANENLQYVLDSENLGLTWTGHYAAYMSKLGLNGLIFPTINVEPKFMRPYGNEVNSEERIFISSLNADNKFQTDFDCHYRLSENAGQNNFIDASVKELSLSDFSRTGISEVLANSNSYEDGFSQSMKLIANLIKSRANATIYNISLGGFDTHVEQSAQHAHLLRMLSRGIFSFQIDIEKAGFGDRVLTLICSEFGRTYKENESKGTDHGHINHVLVVGNTISSIYGNEYRQTVNNPTQKNYASLQASALSWLSCPKTQELSFH